MKWILFLWTSCMAIVFWLPLAEGPPSPFGEADLLIHAGLFLVFGVILHDVIYPDVNRFYGIDWTVLLCFVAIVMETIQGIIPGRSVQTLDYVANILGGWCGGTIVFEREFTDRWLSTLFPVVILLGSGAITIIWGEWFLEILEDIDGRLQFLQPVAYLANGLLSLWWIVRWLRATRIQEKGFVLLYLILTIGMIVLAPPEFLLASVPVIVLFLICTSRDHTVYRSFGRLGLLPLWLFLLIFSPMDGASRLHYLGLGLFTAVVLSVVLDLLWRSSTGYESNGSNVFSLQDSGHS